MTQPALSGTPVLRTARLTLRAPAPQDWESFAAFLASDRSAYVGGPLPREKAWRSFGHIIGHWVMRGWGMFVFCDGDRALGMTGPWQPEGWPEREIGWTVWHPEAEGKGYAAEAARAARAYAFDTLGWDTAVSYIDPSNIRSITLAERMGARLDDAAEPLSDVPCIVYRHKPEFAT